MTTHEREAFVAGYEHGAETRTHCSAREAVAHGADEDHVAVWMNGHDDGVAGDRWRRDRAVGQTDCFEVTR